MSYLRKVERFWQTVRALDAFCAFYARFWKPHFLALNCHLRSKSFDGLPMETKSIRNRLKYLRSIIVRGPIVLYELFNTNTFPSERMCSIYSFCFMVTITLDPLSDSQSSPSRPNDRNNQGPRHKLRGCSDHLCVPRR